MPELTDIEKAIEAHATATAATIAKLTGTIDGLKAQLQDLEQKSDKITLGTPVDGASALAQELVKNPLWGQVAQKQLTRTSVEAKASHLLGLETKNTITGNAPSPLANRESAGVFGGIERRRFLRDFLTTVAVSQGSVEWSKETTFTNAAAVQATAGVMTEGAAKPESALVYTLNESRIPSVAHFVKASNQILADVPQLSQLIDARLRYGLSVKLDDLIVNGSGDVKGWTDVSNHTVFTPSTGDSGIDSINRAIAMLETNEAMATLVLLNPVTYRSLQRLKTGGSGEYLFGSPAGQNRESIWNVQALPTNAVAANKLLVLDAAQSGQFYVREEARIDVGFVNDDFTKNLVTIRGEVRALSVTVRKEAVIYGDLTQ